MYVKPVKHSLVAVVAKGDGVEDEVGVDSNCSLRLVKQVLKWWLIVTILNWVLLNQTRWTPKRYAKFNNFAFANIFNLKKPENTLFQYREHAGEGVLRLKKKPFHAS